jgi:hypothetical protein
MDDNFGEMHNIVDGNKPGLLMDCLQAKVLMSVGEKRIRKRDFDKEAADSRYLMIIDGKELLCVPAGHIRAMIMTTARRFKASGIPMNTLLAGLIAIEPEKPTAKSNAMDHSDGIPIIGPNNKPLKADEYEVDIRAVKNKKGQRLLKARALIKPPYSLRFNIIYDKSLSSVILDTIRLKLLPEAGRIVGLCSYRPENNGPFGTFTVEKCELVEPVNPKRRDA